MIETFEENIKSHHPFIPGDVAVVIGVEILEDPVHQNVVRHVEAAVEELPEDLPVHLVHLGPLRRVLEMSVFSSQSEETRPDSDHCQPVQSEEPLDLLAGEVGPPAQTLHDLLLLLLDRGGGGGDGATL